MCNLQPRIRLQDGEAVGERGAETADRTARYRTNLKGVGRACQYYS